MATNETGGTSNNGGAAGGTGGGKARATTKSAAKSATQSASGADGRSQAGATADTQSTARKTAGGKGAGAATKKAAGGAAAKKSAGGATAKKAASGSGTGAAKKAAGGKRSDLRTDLRQFATERPQGWDHHEWTGLLDQLRERGHDTSDADSIGMSLERERLNLALERVEGLGPQKRKALVDRYSTLWSLRQAGSDEIASTAKVSREVADRVKSSL